MLFTQILIHIERERCFPDRQTDRQTDRQRQTVGDCDSGRCDVTGEQPPDADRETTDTSTAIVSFDNALHRLGHQPTPRQSSDHLLPG